MTFTRSTHLIAIAFLASVAIRPIAAADDAASFARAKDLYLSAAYDEALALLDGLAGEAPAAGRPEIAEYRVFCLLALDRREEAQKAIAAIVNADPFYHPSEAQASPRIRAVFKEVRRELLPKIVQQAYGVAKAAFERKDPAAAEEFDRVLTLLDDADVAAIPSLADLRTVVSGFRDLSRAMTAATPPAEPSASPNDPPPPPPPSLPPPSPSPQIDDPPVPPPATAAPIATGSDSAVTPPNPVFQPMPPWNPTRPADARQEFRGTLEVMIDENGSVTGASLASSVHPQYDPELLKAARTWRFTPAMKEGAPTTYLLVMEIKLRPKT